MKNIFIIPLFSTVLLTACSDGIPKVEDPHNVVVGGQKMTQAAFLQKYCIGKEYNETCAKIKNAMATDTTKAPGGIPRF